MWKQLYTTEHEADKFRYKTLKFEAFCIMSFKKLDHFCQFNGTR